MNRMKNDQRKIACRLPISVTLCYLPPFSIKAYEEFDRVLGLFVSTFVSFCVYDKQILQ